MAAILEMPQYMAYQKKIVYAFIKLNAKSHSFNILCTMDEISCPTIRVLFDGYITKQFKRPLTLKVSSYEKILLSSQAISSTILTT